MMASAENVQRLLPALMVSVRTSSLGSFRKILFLRDFPSLNLLIPWRARAPSFSVPSPNSSHDNTHLSGIGPPLYHIGFTGAHCCCQCGAGARDLWGCREYCCCCCW